MGLNCQPLHTCFEESSLWHPVAGPLEYGEKLVDSDIELVWDVLCVFSFWFCVFGWLTDVCSAKSLVEMWPKTCVLTEIGVEILPLERLDGWNVPLSSQLMYFLTYLTSWRWENIRYKSHFNKPCQFSDQTHDELILRSWSPTVGRKNLAPRRCPALLKKSQQQIPANFKTFLFFPFNPLHKGKDVPPISPRFKAIVIQICRTTELSGSWSHFPSSMKKKEGKHEMRFIIISFLLNCRVIKLPSLHPVQKAH